MLIVHTIGAAAFATAPAMGDGEQPLTIAQVRRSFARSLTWLLTGIAHIGDSALQRNPQIPVT
jgi:hypothetical protein